MYMKEPQNFSNWSEDDFNPSNRPRNTSVEWWNENYVAPARRYRESYSRKTQEEKEQEWKNYPDPLLNPGCPDYWFGGAQDPNLIKVEEKETEEEAESEISYSFPLDEGDSDYPDLTGIDLMIETAPSAGIRLELSEERNKLMLGDSVYEYWKEIQEWYSQSTPVDTSWYRWMPLPDSLLPPPLQGDWEWDFEMFRSAQEFWSQREEEKRRLEAQAQLEEAQHAYEESLVPQPDVTGAGIPKQEWIAPSSGELNKILQQEQHALRGWRSSPAPVSELTFISKFEAIKALEQYFLREEEGAPGDKINYLLMVGQGDFLPTAKEMRQVKKGDLFSLFFSGEPDVRRDIKERYMTDDEYALKLLGEYVAGYESPYVKDIELYLQQVAHWKELTDNAPLPVGYKWFLGNPVRIERQPFLYDFNQQGPLNYVPPENEAFNVASVPSLGLPLTGYGAGFLGMPSGGGGKAESSSLSLPSFPSVSLPGLGAGPSALPSPVGFGGAGWGGAAMPTPSIVPAGGDGAMASGGYFLGGLKQLVAGQGNGRGGFSPALDLGAFLLAPFKNLLPSQRPSAPGSRGGRLTERLFQVPQMLLTSLSPAGPSLAAEQLAGGLFDKLLSPQQPQISTPQIVHRFEKGSVEIHTQKIDAKTLGDAFISFLEEQSRQ